jgi:hypothetical protein
MKDYLLEFESILLRMENRPELIEPQQVAHADDLPEASGGNTDRIAKHTGLAKSSMYNLSKKHTSLGGRRFAKKVTSRERRKLDKAATKEMDESSLPEVPPALEDCSDGALDELLAHTAKLGLTAEETFDAAQRMSDAGQQKQLDEILGTLAVLGGALAAKKVAGWAHKKYLQGQVNKQKRRQDIEALRDQISTAKSSADEMQKARQARGDFTVGEKAKQALKAGAKAAWGKYKAHRAANAPGELAARHLAAQQQSKPKVKTDIDPSKLAAKAYAVRKKNNASASPTTTSSTAAKTQVNPTKTLVTPKKPKRLLTKPSVSSSSRGP